MLALFGLWEWCSDYFVPTWQFCLSIPGKSTNSKWKLRSSALWNRNRIFTGAVENEIFRFGRDDRSWKDWFDVHRIRSSFNHEEREDTTHIGYNNPQRVLLLIRLPKKNAIQFPKKRGKGKDPFLSLVGHLSLNRDLQVLKLGTPPSPSFWAT